MSISSSPTGQNSVYQSIQQRHISNISYASYTKMPPIQHPDYQRFFSTLSDQREGNPLAASGAFSPNSPTENPNEMDVSTSIRRALDAYFTAINAGPEMKKESFVKSSCCGLCDETIIRDVVDVQKTEDKRNTKMKASLSIFSGLRDNVTDPKLRSAILTSEAICHDYFSNDAMRRGCLDRAVELDPDNIPARGAKNKLDKIELHTEVSMTSHVQANQIANVSASASASASNWTSVRQY